MTVRTAAPRPVKVVGRAVSVRVGSATAGRRQLPSLILVGAQRSGTTSLFRALMSHPLIHPASYHKGVNYFDVNYSRSFAWYRGHFPTAGSLRRHGEDALAHLDATLRILDPEYRADTIAPKRIRRVKLFGGGELNRLIIDALRRADGKPLSTPQIADSIIAVKGYGHEAKPAL